MHTGVFCECDETVYRVYQGDVRSYLSATVMLKSCFLSEPLNHSAAACSGAHAAGLWDTLPATLTLCPVFLLLLFQSQQVSRSETPGKTFVSCSFHDFKQKQKFQLNSVALLSLLWRHRRWNNALTTSSQELSKFPSAFYLFESQERPTRQPLC